MSSMQITLSWPRTCVIDWYHKGLHKENCFYSFPTYNHNFMAEKLRFLSCNTYQVYTPTIIILFLIEISFGLKVIQYNVWETSSQKCIIWNCWYPKPHTMHTIRALANSYMTFLLKYNAELKNNKLYILKIDQKYKENR